MNRRQLYHAITAVMAALWAGLGLYGGSQVFGAPASYPLFSWRHVPTYADLGSYTGFTPAEAKFLATHFSALSIEKGQGMALEKPGKPPNGEADFLRTARQLKTFNPKVCVLFYWNARRFFPFYQADKTVENAWISNKTRHASMVHHTPWGWAIRNSWYRGKPQGGEYVMSNPGFQKWWVNIAVGMAAHRSVDGIFVDGTIPPATSSPKTKAACLSLVQRLHDKLSGLNKPNLILLNGLEDCLNNTGMD
ncbi:MAG: hypothetical protein HKL95_09375 [Phycisphaerae bacterium]|nr:hypothetical protein [Phycisphaerae bacterium]